MSPHPASAGAHDDLLALYDRALPQVYGYLLRRCGAPAVAEDLTAETFLAAVDALRRPGPPCVDVGWLIGTARHKLADHWRRIARDERNLRAVDLPAEAEDPWDATVDALVARAALAQLGAHHQAVLTLRYLDDLTVPQVAAALGRTLHATEALLVRARAAFRSVYEQNPTGEEVDRG